MSIDPKQQKIPGTLAVKFLQSLFDVVQNSCITKEQLLKAAGLELDMAADGNQRISGNQYCDLLKLAAELCDDSDIGLHMGEAIKPGHYGVLGYACMSSKTFDDTIQRMHRYQSLVSDVGSSQVSQNDDQVKFQFICETSLYPPRQLSEEHLAGVLTFSRWISNNKGAPTAVHFQHPAPKYISEHKRIFACPILFDQDETAIYFPAELLDAPLPQADPLLSKMMDTYAEQQLIKLPTGESLMDQAKRALADLLQNGEPNLEKLAARLELSSRSLQRQLKQENLSYQTLLEKIRHQLALSYIHKDHLSLIDIAFLLGFSEQSSFQRAFKRWTGETPGKYRKNT